jgi:hypothetical protein
VTQFGQLVNEYTRDDIRTFLERNRRALSPDEVEEVKEVENPKHIEEMYSVYRTHM